jgi:hypothetical protein
MGVRIWILIAIDVFFFLGLLVLVFLGGGEHWGAVVACIGLIAYVSWSIRQLMEKAKEPTTLPK